jgi:hypothetical protein
VVNCVRGCRWWKMLPNPRPTTSVNMNGRNLFRKHVDIFLTPVS